ncbi:class A beta-lactamase-related serine hydrolase [Flavobacteriaceae bacterium AU392]|nr:class A beta-lactamase-related serine hydrolase [Flavobacteriaceae bacterium]RKM86005.1 class A beta-lactamase-related serine hydrolase [Flavobacteriaceae bacterium AU392]
MNLKYILLLFIILSMKGLNAQNARLDSLNTYLDTVDKFGFSGQVLVEQNGKVIINRAFGQLSENSSQNITDETLFGIASVSKQFTAAAICLLAQREKLKFDDSLGEFFSGVPNDKSNITIHQLLTHTSGLQGGDLIRDFENISKKEMLSRILSSQMKEKPGEKWRYSNIGYNVLAFIIEKVTGVSYEEFLTKEIFNPLNMLHTRIIGGKYSWEGLTAANAINGSTDVGSPMQWKYNMRTLGSGNIASTVSDLHKWNTALQNFTLLNKELTERLFYPHTQIQGTEFYGYGWFVFKDENAKTKLIEHGGDYEKGFNGVIYKYLEKDVTIFILSNKYEPFGANLSSRWAIFYAIRNYLTKEVNKLPYINKTISNTKNPDVLGNYKNKNHSSSIIISKTQNSDYSLEFEGLDVTNEIFQVPDSIKQLSQNAIDKTNHLVNELVWGNLEAYKKVIERPDRWDITFAQEWRDIIKTNGEIISFKMIAAIPNFYNDGVKCIVKLFHERGTSSMTFSWMDYGRDKLYETIPNDDIKLNRVMQKTKSGTWVIYDLFTKKWLEILVDIPNRNIRIGPLLLEKQQLKL